MADNKKYYYLKLKDDFFDSEEIIVLESMDNGYKYSNILLKMYLRSIKREGLLTFNERIPYNPKMIATVTGHNVNDVKQALVLFQEMGMIETLSNGAIYMLDIQNFIGRSTTEADRVRAYRNKISEKKASLLEGSKAIDTSVCTNVQQMSDKCTPELELELELELERELESDDTTVDKKPSTEEEVVKEEILTSTRKKTLIKEWNKLELQQLRSLNDNTKRYTRLKARIKEYSFDEVIEGAKRIGSSKFLQGDNNRGWKITFDWFVRPSNFIKVLEGEYDDKGGNSERTNKGNIGKNNKDGEISAEKAGVASF